MRQPPALATLLLDRLGPADESLAGDLHEEYATGRSKLWFWRQALAALACGTVAEIRRSPVGTVRSIAAGWAVTAAVFVSGDGIADGLARLIWHWNRQTAYVDDVWWPFYIGAFVVTYGGFALGALIVARTNPRRPAILVGYVTSIFAVLSVTGVAFAVLIRLYVRIPLPHPLFYLVSTTLAFYWYSGVLLVPLITLLFGTMATPRRHMNVAR
jgi:hypothetical protein